MGDLVSAVSTVFSVGEARKSRKDAAKQFGKKPPPVAQEGTVSASSSGMRAQKRKGIAASVLSGQDSQQSKTTLG
jgi:hypothetical protein